MKDQAKQLGQLKKAHRAMESDRSGIRNKVQNLLQELDKIEVN